ncbi:hypothetical protein [Aphanizomenon sp. UHCC 0183]|nr:hypothetical protein [Aphanizomenon sp. UHCC 0183]
MNNYILDRLRVDRMLNKRSLFRLKKESGVSSQESESISRGFKPATD